MIPQSGGKLWGGQRIAHRETNPKKNVAFNKVEFERGPFFDPAIEATRKAVMAQRSIDAGTFDDPASTPSFPKLRVEASNPYTWAGTNRSVTSFGAVANDGLDDSSAFQAAFNASADGDVVTIPAGTFTLTGSDQLHINEAIDINGAGIASTIIDITATTWCCQGVFKVNDLPTRLEICASIARSPAD